MKKILLFAAIAIFAATAAAQQYKWVDKDGKTRYGDTPPAGVKATPLKGPSRPSEAPAGKSAASSGAKDGKAAARALTPAEQDAEFRKRQQAAQKTAEKDQQSASEKEQRRENCARAQEQQRAYQSGQRVARTDSKGERYFLDEAQVSAELTKANALVNQLCD
jgi:hypothetical protein